MACLIQPDDTTQPVRRPEGGWSVKAVESVLGGPVLWRKVPTPAGVYVLALRADHVAAERPANVRASAAAMAPVHGPAVLIPPWEVKK